MSEAKAYSDEELKEYATYLNRKMGMFNALSGAYQLFESREMRFLATIADPKAEIVQLKQQLAERKKEEK